MDNFETDDENDAQEEDPECINNADGFYYRDCDENESDSDWTTPTESNDVPEEIRMAYATGPSFSDIPTTVMNATNDSFSTNVTLLAAKTKEQECVPFLPNRGDNITGIPPEYVGAQLSKTIQTMNQQNQQKLRDLCWETLFGQELVKLTVLDLIFTIFATLFMDFFRALFVRFMNKCWCWDLEKKFPKVTIFQIKQYHQFYKYLIFFVQQYGDFKIAENILHLVNNQGQVWMGMFFAPGLAILNLVKLGILMYFRSWAVLTCNVPHEVIFRFFFHKIEPFLRHYDLLNFFFFFRASRSNNFYLALLLTMLFLCVLPVSYAIVWIEPSWHCGPFAHHARIHRVFTDTLKSTLPK